MKKFNLSVAMIGAVAMTACTDYKTQITEAHDDYVKNVGVAFGDSDVGTYSDNTEQSSGCRCSLLAKNLINDGAGGYYYDYGVVGENDIYWKVDGCTSGYIIRPKLDSSLSGNMEAGLYLDDTPDVSLVSSREFSGKITVGGPYSSVAVGVKVGVSNPFFSETILCPAVEVRGVNYGSSSGSTDEFLSTNSYSFYPTTACGDLWCGLTDTEGKVESGLERDGSAGYWYSYGDGYSNFTYPAPGVIDNKFGPLVSTHKAIYAKIALENGVEYPFAGFAFNLVSGLEDGDDISDWDGICLVYGATYRFELELGVENEEVITEYNNYKAVVPSFIVTHTIDIPWSSFKQESGWGKKIDRTEALKKVSTIRLKYSGAPGNSTTVFIQSIGRYGTCQ